ncbi:hypothetical protein JCM17960_04750 [Magnetospira thiophila]
MLKRLLLLVILLILAWGFWISPDFKEIAAGVALFLFGMLFLEQGFHSFTGGALEKLLKLTTDRLWKSIGFGMLATTVLQSSSLVSVITISFLGSGLILLPAGIGIIFGANIGTTTGAWLVAGFGLKVNIAAYAMPMLVFGVILIFQKSKGMKGVGYILAGLGLLFLGIHHMKEGFEAFKSNIDLAAYAMPGLGGLLAFCGIGIFATVVMQSSHATLVLILTGLSAGQITYENALALAIGANIGTTITAIIGAMSSNYQGKRLAGAHLMFNMTTGAIAIIFIGPFIWAVDHVAVTFGIPEDDYALKLAVFHTIFNLVGVIVMTPLIDRMVNLLERLIPRPWKRVMEPLYLQDAAFDFPETLLESVRRETLHLYDNSLPILALGLSLEPEEVTGKQPLDHLLDTHREPITFDLEDLYATDVKSLYGAILDFISRAQTKLPQDNAASLYALRNACHAIVKAVKDVKHLSSNLQTYIAIDNVHMRRQYDTLRRLIVQLLRDLHDLREQPVEDRHVLALDHYKLAIEEGSAVADGTLDRLIRERRITPAMATSLMNDVSYTRSLIWNLIDMAQAVFGSKEMDVRKAEAMVRLTDVEIDEIKAAEGRAKEHP